MGFWHEALPSGEHVQETPFGYLHRISGRFLTWWEYFDQVEPGAGREDAQEWPGRQPAPGGWRSIVTSTPSSVGFVSSISLIIEATNPLRHSDENY